VLEDGEGRVLYEHNSLVALADQAGRSLRSSKSALVARIMVGWVAVRHFVQEKVEPIIGEAEETFAHFAPQLAAFA
jgi:hypothetical protein